MKVISQKYCNKCQSIHVLQIVLRSLIPTYYSFKINTISHSQFFTHLINQYHTMGCSESTEVIEKSHKTTALLKKIQPTTTKQQAANHFLLGNLSQMESIFCKVDLKKGEIHRMSIPHNLTPLNLSSMLYINNQQYLISGGVNHDLTYIVNTCAIYNAKSHAVTLKKSMLQSRYTHSSILVNQCVYVIGGRYFGEDEVAILNSCQKYDLALDAWIPLPSMKERRCTCYVMQWKQEIYVFGGYTGKFQRSTIIEKINPHEKAWEVVDFQLQRGIQSGFALSILENQIIIFGGTTNSGPTSTVVTINFQNKTVHSCTKLHQEKTLYKAFVEASKLFIFGGSQKMDVEVYDFIEQKSEIFQHSNVKQFAIDAFQYFTFSEKSILIEAKKEEEEEKNSKNIKKNQNKQQVLIFGVIEDPFILELNLNGPELENLTVPWNLKLYQKMCGVKIHSQITNDKDLSKNTVNNVNKSTKYLLFGGIENDLQDLASGQAYEYDHAKSTALKLQNMKVPRFGCTYQLLQNELLVFGGADFNSKNQIILLSCCQKYDLAKNQWQELRSLPEPRINSMSLTYKNQIYVFGGIVSGNKVSQQVLRYDCINDLWSRMNDVLPFGFSSALLYQRSEDEYLLFGGKCENEVNKHVWTLRIMNDNKEIRFKIDKIKEIKESKTGHRVMKNKQDNILIILGDQDEFQTIQFYQDHTFQSIQMQNLKKALLKKVGTVNDKLFLSYLFL